MKKLMLLMAVTAITATSVFAQAPAQKDYKAERAEWEKKLKDDLKLTPDQVVKFDALSKEYNDKIDAILQDGGLSQEAQKEKKMALKKEKEARLLEFLTPEQQAKYKELIEQKKKDMSNKPAGS
jgi:Spy/CpxP family protein refolding chaperone